MKILKIVAIAIIIVGFSFNLSAQEVKVLLKKDGTTKTFPVKTIVLVEVCAYQTFVEGWTVARKTDHHLWGAELTEDTDVICDTRVFGEIGTLLKIKNTNLYNKLYKGSRVIISEDGVLYIAYVY